MTLSSLLSLTPGSRVVLIGSGGKTTIARLLAEENASLPVLISPTTRIGLPAEGTVLCSAMEGRAHRPHGGVQYLGIPTGEKLCSLPLDELADIVENYPLTLHEGDGARRLPLTAWAPYEPVIPPFTTHTLAILPAGATTLRATEETVCRLPQFLELTGLAEGQQITPAALAALITSPTGMFAKAVGRRILLLNQADTPALEKAAQAIVTAVKETGFVLDSILIGSAHQSHWKEG